MLSPTGVAVVLPVKAFGDAKQRLRTTLDATDRARLARHLATGVARTAIERGARVFVACDDLEVRRWATDVGADVAWTPGLGLNGAIDRGVVTAVEAGAVHLVVAHADLPRPADLLSTVSERTIVLVPDRHRDGTNVMSFPADAPITADYGPASFRRHLAAAGRVATDRRVRLRVLLDHALGLDVDTADDLRHPPINQELPTWLRTRPDNRSIRAG